MASRICRKRTIFSWTWLASRVWVVVVDIMVGLLFHVSRLLCVEFPQQCLSRFEARRQFQRVVHRVQRFLRPVGGLECLRQPELRAGLIDGPGVERSLELA